MKKTFFCLALTVFISINCFSQIKKKTWLLGGYANINFSNTDNSYLIVNPNTGLFISDKICVGLALPIIHVNNNFYYGVTPFGRYYLKDKEPGSIFFALSVGVTSIFENANTIGSAPVSAGIGYVWLLNNSIGFESLVTGGTDFDRFDLGLFLGFQIYFNKSGT